MSYALAFSNHAENDIIEAILWYNKEKRALGFEFYDKLTEKISVIADTPFYYATRFKSIRAAGISKFPFLIYFKVYELEKRILVIGVFHTSRNQKEVLKRK